MTEILENLAAPGVRATAIEQPDDSTSPRPASGAGPFQRDSLRRVRPSAEQPSARKRWANVVTQAGLALGPALAGLAAINLLILERSWPSTEAAWESGNPLVYLFPLFAAAAWACHFVSLVLAVSAAILARFKPPAWLIVLLLYHLSMACLFRFLL